MPHKTNRLQLDQLAADPAGVPDGSFWYNTTDDVYRGVVGGDVCDFVCAQPVLVINNTDTTTQINTAGVTPFDEMFGTIAIDTQPGAYTVDLAAGTVEINRDGIYRILGHIDMVGGLTTATARTNIGMRFSIGGAQVSPWFQHNYNRDASGHNEVSQGIAWVVSLSAGDVLQFEKQRRAGGAGTVNLETTNNFLSFERIG